MKKQSSLFVPSDEKIAHENYARAIKIRKNYEAILLRIIQEETQLFPYIDCKRINESIFRVIKAYLVEFATQDSLAQFRGKRNEPKN